MAETSYLEPGEGLEDKAQLPHMTAREIARLPIRADERFAGAHALIESAYQADAEGTLNPEAALGILCLLEDGAWALADYMSRGQHGSLIDTPEYATPIGACVSIARRASRDENMETGGLCADEIAFMREQLARVLEISSKVRAAELEDTAA